MIVVLKLHIKDSFHQRNLQQQPQHNNNISISDSDIVNTITTSNITTTSNTTTITCTCTTTIKTAARTVDIIIIIISCRTIRNGCRRWTTTTTRVASQPLQQLQEEESTTITSRRLDAAALQEQQDQQEGDDDDVPGGTGGYMNDTREKMIRRRNDDHGEDEITSNVSSTASEMGTVINLGNNAARMAEIEAMAAMMEAEDESGDAPSSRNDNRDDDDDDDDLHIEEPPKLSSSLLHNDSGLDLPMLESSSFEQPSMLLPRSQVNTSINSRTSSSSFDMGFGYVNRQHPNDSHTSINNKNDVSSDRSNENNYSLEVGTGITPTPSTRKKTAAASNNIRNGICCHSKDRTNQWSWY